MDRFDLILVNTPSYDKPSTIRLGLLTMASYVREHGYSVTILDGSMTAIKKQLGILRLDRSLIGLTASTDVAPVAYQLCDFVKTHYPKALCILGGNHATALPERTLRESRFDLLILGEGELTLIDVLEKLRNGGEIKHIQGTAFLENGTFVQNKPRELIRVLDTLPFPAYDLINIKNHLGSIRSHHVKTKKCLYLLISRGCPFDCVFCSSKIMWHRRLRWHSVDYIIELILKAERDLEIDSISFLDDELVCNRKRIVELTNRLVETGLSNRILWECQSTVKFFDEEVAQALKIAGCRLVRFGLESGSQKSLDFLKRGRIKLDESRRALDICHMVGLSSLGTFIIGTPDETIEDILETIEFIEKSNLDNAAIFVATPYPGTELYNIALEKSYLDPEISWTNFIVEGKNYKPIYSNEHFSGEQLHLIRDYINNNIVKPINWGRKPRMLDHRREIEKILSGDLTNTRENLNSKLGYLILHGLERPDRIIPYISRKLVRFFKRRI